MCLLTSRFHVSLSFPCLLCSSLFQEYWIFWKLRPACVYGWLHVAAIETVAHEIDIFASPTDNFNIDALDPHAEEQYDRWKHLTICSEIDFAGSVSFDGGFGFMWFGRELVVHFCVVCTDIF